MMQIFSKTRTLTGLILILSPLLSVLSADLPLSFWPPFFCSMLFALLPLRAVMNRMSFRFWLMCCCFLSIIGIYFADLQNPGSSALPAPILLGCSASGLLLILPPWIAVGRYVSAAPFLGLAWSCSLLCSMLLQILTEFTPVSALALAVILTSVGLFCIRGRIPHVRLLEAPPHDFFSPSMVKAVVFFLCLLTSIGIGSVISPAKSPVSSESVLLFSFFLVCGPLLSSWFTEKKGIYSSCILTIFLTETALLLTGFSENRIFTSAGGAVLALAAGSTAVILPMLTFYLCGRTGYIRGLFPLLLCIPVSLLFSWPFRIMASHGELVQQDAAAFLFFLLITGFLCIFFAWKHRFIILKNKRI